ncbi:hypothetical protein WA158_002812 [Blastocystis sp. Blastoise]
MAMNKISQESFNEIVKENMEDFEMELKEAIEDALEQCRVQKVDVSGLITDPLLIFVSKPNADEMLQELQSSSVNDDRILEIFSIIENYYIKGLIEEFNQTYLNQMVSVLLIMKEKKTIFIPYLDLLKHFMSQRSGKLIIGKVTNIWDMIIECFSSQNLVLESLEFLATLLIGCQPNKDIFRNQYNSFEKVLIESLLSQNSKDTIYIQIIHIFTILCSNDDTSLPPKSFQNALALQENYNIINQLYPLLLKTESSSILLSLYTLYSKLIVNEQSCKLVLSLHMNQYLQSVLSDILRNKDLLISYLSILKSLSKSDSWKLPIYTILNDKSNLSQLFILYDHDLSILIPLYTVLSAITLRNSEVSTYLIENYSIDIITIRYLKEFTSNSTLDHFCLHLLRNSIKGNEEKQNQYHNDEIYQLILTIIHKFKHLNSIGCLTLREIGYDTSNIEAKNSSTIMMDMKGQLLEYNTESSSE